jgi:hypothetical protein
VRKKVIFQIFSIMKKVHLQHLTKDKKLLEATFSPSHGMNLLSFKHDGFELIDTSTDGDFKKRLGGLGPLIGPHFYHRKKEDVKAVSSTLFPHIKSLSDSQKKDPLSHGVGRYCAWNYDETSTSINSHLSGLDAREDVTLASIEGFNFKMDFSAHLTAKGLEIDYRVVSENHPSTIGLHYYLRLPNKKGFVTISSMNKYNDMGNWKKIPKEWLNEDGALHFDLKNQSDFGFLPNTTDNTGEAILTTPSHSLKISYKAASDEHAFQLYHPKDSSFVCIEPVSAKNPRSPAGNSHRLKVKIEIL